MNRGYAALPNFRTISFANRYETINGTPALAQAVD
jgi:hypothetical protein